MKLNNNIYREICRLLLLLMLISAVQCFQSANFKRKAIVESVSSRNNDQYFKFSLDAFDSRGNFNPFTSRTVNSNLRWYENGISDLYKFIDEQPLLTAEQEQEYGKVLILWRNVRDAKRRIAKHYNMTLHTVPHREVARVLSCSVETIDKIYDLVEISKKKMINSNLKLILAVVSRYRSSSISNFELIAEGAIGLAKAVDRFDCSKGFRFATYATWYVHQAIADFVRWRRHPAKMPGRYLILLRRVKQFSKEYEEQHGRGNKPNIPQIASALGESMKDVTKVLQMWKYPLSTSMEIRPQNGKDSRETKIEDLIASKPKVDIVAKERNLKSFRHSIDKLMHSRLTEIERDVIRSRLGLDGDGVAVTLLEISRRYRVSLNEVEKIEEEARKKLTAGGVLNRIFREHASSAPVKKGTALIPI